MGVRATICHRRMKTHLHLFKRGMGTSSSILKTPQRQFLILDADMNEQYDILSTVILLV